MADGQVEQLPFGDLPLGRHIRHDPQNRRFAVPAGAMPTSDIFHRNMARRINQGDLGCCTCATGALAVNHNPNRKRRRPHPPATVDDAVRWYRRATILDPFEGTWPPTDTGSSGHAACQAMREEGVIAGYEWAFGFEAGVGRIHEAPWMQGTYWTYNMFHPDRDGRVHPTGGDAGGHEYLWVGVEIMSATDSDQNRSWFLNPWWNPAKPWGRGCYFYLTWGDHRALLARNGDLVRPVMG